MITSRCSSASRPDSSSPALPALVALVDTIEARTPYTHGHSLRVTELAVRLAEALRYPPAWIDRLHAAALIHDVGKLGVPDAVLLKQGPLTPEEHLIMERHAAIGGTIVHLVLPELAGIVRAHHERWDGEGYPDRLPGKRIPVEARIIAVADAYDAMISDRPYRPGMTHASATAILQAGRDRQWQAELVDAFLGSA